MPPKRKLSCSCKSHNEFCADFEGCNTVHRNDGRKIRRDVINALIEKGSLSDRSLYICDGCADYAEKKFMSSKKQKTNGISCDDVLVAIENNNFTEDELMSISKCIGSKISSGISKDTFDCTKCYNSDAFLEDFELSGSPCGSYSTIINYLKKAEPLQAPSCGDIVTFIDNNQVIERKWHVEKDYKSKSSVTTTVVHIVANNALNLQKNPCLSPATWWSPRISKEDVEAISIDIEKKQTMFDRYRLAKMLGFTSPKAQLPCQTATDHHKSWQIIQIFMFSMACELLKLYLEHAHLQHELPTAAGYFQWVPERHPMYVFMSQAVFTYCLSLHVFRAGIRRNNSEAINVAKARFAPLFYGLSMPFYMETFFRDSVLRTKCPPELLNFLESYESYSVSGNDSKGEGGDFVLEANNRMVKRLLPAGLPDEQAWVRACRNVDRMAKIHNHMVETLGISEYDDPDYSFSYGIKEEVAEFRRIIKDLSILLSPNMEGLSGEKLEGGIKNITDLCINNFKSYADHVIQSGSLEKRLRPKPILISKKQKERSEDFNFMTKQQLKDRIETFQLDEKEKAEWRQIIKGKKEGYVKFLTDLENK